MAQPIILPSFAAGELAPSMYGRVDLAKYHVGAALLRNYFVDYRGGASSRTGTEFVGQVKDSSNPTRLIPFQFNTLQTYVLVFGNQTLRFVTNGGYVLETATTITGITQANPGVVTDPAHGYSNGDLVFLQNIAGMTQLNQRYAIITSATTNTYTLTDMYGVPIDTTGYGAYTSGGTASRVYTIATPYAAADLALIKFTQSADVMTLVHTAYTPQTLTRQGNASWTMAAVTFQPTAAPPTGATATFVNNGTGTAYPNTQYEYAITATVGGVESLPSTPASVTNLALGQNVGAQNHIAWNAVTGATIYNIYRTQENLSTTVPQGALFGFIGSTNPAGTNTFVDDNILPDFTNCPPQAYNPFTVAGNPGCVCYYQQRQVFAGMANAPEQMDFSKSGDFFNMDFSIPSKDDDNIEITIASQQVNAIEFMLPLNNLLVLTSSGAWAVSGGAVGAALTPQQVQATPQAYNGCSNVCPPIAINYDILYVQARGSIVRDLAYNFYVNLYTGTDITMLSNHLFFGHQLLEWTYAEEPFKVVWAVREDGILLSLTYVKEQDVIAWAHHDTEGLFKSVCSVTEGQENAVYVVVERFVQGQYLQYIERFASRQLGGDPTIGLPADPSLAWCVDAGLQYPLNKPNATLTPVAPDAIPVIYGINIIAGGKNYSASTVLEVTDSTGSGGLLTPIIVGGVITGVTIVAAGTGWTNPTITVFDPTGAGSGAALQTILASPVTMNASAAVFGSTHLGDVVRVNGGLGYVLSIPTASQIIVNVVSDLTGTWPSTAGNWSVTTPVQTISGLDHLNGETVSILADGSVAPQQTVVNGSITLDRMYSAITVGLPFTCQLKSLYIDVQEQGGTIQSKRKTIPAVSVRLQDSRGVYAGPTFDSLIAIKERTTEAMGQPIMLFTGDQRVLIPASYNVPGQVCIQVTDPLPSTILALIPELQIGDN
jgi:Ubiquitin-activating enzyme E1 FCCH domain